MNMTCTKFVIERGRGEPVIVRAEFVIDPKDLETINEAINQINDLLSKSGKVSITEAKL